MRRITCTKSKEVHFLLNFTQKSDISFELYTGFRSQNQLREMQATLVQLKEQIKNTQFLIR